MMKILLDTANLEKIESVLPYIPVDGITTNPSILAKEAKDVKATLLKMRELIGEERMLHAQTTAQDAKGMVEQAKALTKSLGRNFYIKIPVGLEGLRAVEACKALGLHVTVTAIFTPMQALLAAKAGADFVAPYVDRLDNITSDGVHTVSTIVALLEQFHYPTQVLAASFKNVQQVMEVALAGAHSVTINADLCKKLLFHPYTDKSIADFATDWSNAFGEKQLDALMR